MINNLLTLVILLENFHNCPLQGDAALFPHVSNLVPIYRWVFVFRFWRMPSMHVVQERIKCWFFNTLIGPKESKTAQQPPQVVLWTVLNRWVGAAAFPRLIRKKSADSLFPFQGALQHGSDSNFPQRLYTYINCIQELRNYFPATYQHVKSLSKSTSMLAASSCRTI